MHTFSSYQRIAAKAAPDQWSAPVIGTDAFDLLGFVMLDINLAFACDGDTTRPIG